MGQRTVLVHSVPGDLHSLVATAALRARGHRVARSYTQGLPSRMRVSLEFGSIGADEIDGPDGRENLGAFDVVWHRRSNPARPIPAIPADDRFFVRRELEFLARTLKQATASAFQVNPPDAARRADLKPLQLQLARRAGLQVPETLVSNDPLRVRQFIERVGETIYKPLRPYVWKNKDGRRWATYTARVTPADVTNDALLHACPGIYQRRVAKHFEVRAQFFGDSCFAIRIDPGALPMGELDWRFGQSAAACGGPVNLPPRVFEAARTLMRELGIVAGGFDFIVTPGGEWVFLEVNEAGQFLFVERWCPQLPVLDAFCRFLESRAAEFRYRPCDSPLRYADVCASADSADALIATDLARWREHEAGGAPRGARREPNPAGELPA